MKVCIISSTVFACPPAGYSGLEFLAWQHAKGLADKGHQVALVAPQGSSCPNVTIIPTGPPGGWDEMQAFPAYQRELPKFDVVIDHSWQKWSYTLKMRGALKAPVLGVSHAPVNTMYQHLPPVEKPCFVCISQDQANHFEALFSRPARVARNGIDLDHYKPIEGVKRTQRFLFLARFSTIKGPHIALESCRKVGVGLDLIGDTSITNEPEYLEKCKSMCDWDSLIKPGEEPEHSWNDSRIILRGPATRGECVWWFSQAYAFLHPNKIFREPLGLAPLEAQACGLPVIAWDYGALRETVKQGETGFLVNRDIGEKQFEHYIELLRDKSDHAMSVMRLDCRHWASQFSVQGMIDRYDELIHEAVETGGW